MTKKELSELLGMIDELTQQERHTIESLHSERQNSSVTDIYYKSMGRAEAFEAVADALRGNKMSLKLLKHRS